MYDYDKLVQRLAKSKPALLYLKLCYYEEIDTDEFRKKLTDCCFKCGVSEDEAYAMFYATRLPKDPCRDEIMCTIEKIEAREQSEQPKRRKAKG